MISLVTKQSSCSGTARSFIFLPLGSLSCSSGLCSLSYMYSEWQICLLHGFKLKFKVNSNVFAHTLLISFGLKQMPAETCVLLIFDGPHTRKIIEGLLHCWHEMPPLSVSFRATSQRLLFSVLFMILILISRQCNLIVLMNLIYLGLHGIERTQSLLCGRLRLSITFLEMHFVKLILIFFPDPS